MSNFPRIAFRTFCFGIMLLGLVLTMHRDSFAADLQVNAAVDGAEVHMGEVLSGALADPAKANLVIAQAPAPGESKVLSAQTILNIAFQHGVQVDNPAGISRVIVTRNGIPVPQSVVEDRLHEQLAGQDISGDYEIRLMGRAVSLSVAMNEIPDVHVDNFQYDDRSHRFQAQISAGAQGTPGAEQAVYGMAVPVVDVPVLAQRLDRNAVISDADVVYKKMEAGRIGTDVALDASELVGMSPRRPLPADRPVRLRDVQEPVVVSKNAYVTMQVIIPGMTLTAAGRALEDGSMGSVIRVINADTHQTVTAEVIGPNQVRAAINSNLVTASLVK